MTPEEHFEVCKRIVEEYVPYPRPPGWSGDDILLAHILNECIAIRRVLEKICEERLIGPV